MDQCTFILMTTNLHFLMQYLTFWGDKSNNTCCHCYPYSSAKGYMTEDYFPEVLVLVKRTKQTVCNYCEYADNLRQLTNDDIDVTMEEEQNLSTSHFSQTPIADVVTIEQEEKK